MTPRTSPARARARARRPVGRLAVATLLVLLAPAGAHGAQLVGGREQSRLAAAFYKRHAHRGQVIVSTRVASVSRAWALVTSVAPQPAPRTSARGRPPALQRTYLHLTRKGIATARPPPRVRADLAAAFRVALVYAGSGSEAVTYHQRYGSVCVGGGGFIDDQTVTVRPMTWSVRYIVDLDSLQTAVRGPAGTVIVPSVSFDPSGSRLSARETLARTAIDVGCNGQPTTYQCIDTEVLGKPADGLLSVLPAGGIEVGVPTRSISSGDCDPGDYTLGPTLFDSGGTTAVTPRLALVAGQLPANPYAPVKVSWPASSGGLASGFLAGPCQGDGAACRDSFDWTGSISLRKLP